MFQDRTEVERRRCVEICRRRAELWRRTSLASSSIASAREEARARANEAAYLADLLESGADLSEDADGGVRRRRLRRRRDPARDKGRNP